MSILMLLKGMKDISFASLTHPLRTLRLICILSLPLTALLFQSSAQKKNVKFTDVTARAGIDFRYTFGDYHYENILESSGSGVTVFDY
jgi:hypothetical protein